jgi:vacuolar iron transporter family protein
MHQIPPEEEHYHAHVDPHRETSSLSDVILGGQDGLVNVLGVILGVAAATGDTRIILVAGLAATFAESVSMGAVAYTSMLADHAYYQSELEREYRHIEEAPNLEKQEIRDIYSRKGFAGKLLDTIVETITQNKDIWVESMLMEEHKVVPVDRKLALRSAFTVFVAALVGSFIPLIPFIFLPVRVGIGVSLGVSAIALYWVGSYKARNYVGHPVKSGLEMMAIGIVSALVGYGIGLIFKIV